MKRFLILMIIFFGFTNSRAEGYNYSALYITAGYVYDYSGSIGLYYKNSDIFGAYFNFYASANDPANSCPEIITPSRNLLVSSKLVDNPNDFYGLTVGGTANLTGILSLQAGIAIQNTHKYKIYEKNNYSYTTKFTTEESKTNLGLDVGISLMVEYNFMLNVGYNSAGMDKFWVGFGILIY